MVITVQCPSCATSFPVDTAKVPEGGVNARCSVCTAIFRVEAAVEEESFPIHELEPPAATEAPLEEGTPEEAEPEVAIVEVVESEVVEPGAEISLEEVPEPVIPEGVISEEAIPEEAESEAAPSGETEPEPAVSAEAPSEDWVFETEEELDTSAVDVEPMGTVESFIDVAREEVEGEPEPAMDEAEPLGQEAEPPVEGLAGLESIETVPEPAAEGPATDESEAPAEPALETPREPTLPAEPEAPAEKPSGFTFGHRDPHDKARRLARVLVSDMIMYNPDRHERALAGGTLKEDFEEEIAKSWREYVDQVGDEIANGTSYWSDALNEVLAKGERVF